MSGAPTGASSWISRLIQNAYTNTIHSYISAIADIAVTEAQRGVWKTTVVVGTPARETKCILVPEMNDFYTDEELNTVYHSADEYRTAIQKYGYIYKYQKFENADTVDKLMTYAKDWIKNNYHGGISSFTITALDMHACGETDQDGYFVGDRVAVRYVDSDIQEEVTQNLTCISAEYDLLNPERNSYKIGIPDITLNKVYGETAKSGGGGGGGKTQTDQSGEDGTEAEDLADTVADITNEMNSSRWALLYKAVNNGIEDLENQDLPDEVQTPNERDPLADFKVGMTCDFSKIGSLAANLAQLNSVKSQFVNASRGVDTGSLSAKTGNIGTMNAKNLLASAATIGGELSTQSLSGKTGEFTETLDTKDLVASESISGKTGSFSESLGAKDLSATGSVSGASGVFSDSLKVGENDVALAKDIPAVPSMRVREIMDGTGNLIKVYVPPTSSN